jgi:putative inorganic carbon (hco3(-)) transporter
VGSWGALAGMALGLALFYRGQALPLAPLPQLFGLALFAGLALLRPGLALLFVPLAAPLYLIPAAIPGLRAEPLRLPLHEVALLVVAAASVARAALDQWAAVRAQTTDPRRPTTDRSTPGAGHQRASGGLTPAAGGRVLDFARRYAPHLLLLVAGVLGVLMAVPEGRGAALREFRWLIAEPLIFYALLRHYARGRSLTRDHLRPDPAPGEPADSRAGWSSVLPDAPVVTALVLAGVGVAAIGLLQLAGLDLAPLLGEKQNFGTANVVEVDGLRRVTSVFGHPNNLGLFLGRVWPIAAALALLGLWSRDNGASSGHPRPAPLVAGPRSLLYGLAALVCLAGLAISFSRGAWLGALAAGGVLAIGIVQWRGAGSGDQARTRLRLILGLSSLVLVSAIVAGLTLSLRGGLGGGSVDARVLLWREALELIRLHPLGLGLDQFYYYHNPEFGRSIMDPALAGTSEQYASHPHNLVLDAWLNVGPLGLAALAWLVARCLRAAVAALRRGPDPLALGVVAAMIAALVHGTVDVFYFVEDLALLFWLLLALAERARERVLTPR